MSADNFKPNTSREAMFAFSLLQLQRLKKKKKITRLENDHYVHCIDEDEEDKDPPINRHQASLKRMNKTEMYPTNVLPFNTKINIF